MQLFTFKEDNCEDSEKVVLNNYFILSICHIII